MTIVDDYIKEAECSYKDERYSAREQKSNLPSRKDWNGQERIQSMIIADKYPLKISNL